MNYIPPGSPESVNLPSAFHSVDINKTHAEVGLSDKFPFRPYIICWGNLSLSKIIGWGGGGPPLPHPFILQNCVIVSYKKDKLHVF